MAPAKIGTDGANTFPSTIRTSVDDGLLHPDPMHYVTNHLQEGIESDHFRVRKNIPKIGGFQSFNAAGRTIAGFEVMLWLRKGFGFSGGCQGVVATYKDICDTHIYSVSWALKFGSSAVSQSRTQITHVAEAMASVRQG